MAHRQSAGAGGGELLQPRTPKCMSEGGVCRGPARRRPCWEAHSPFSRCWKEGENSLAVILAMRASSWAFCAAVRAASALAREWEVLAGGGREGGQAS